MRIYYNTSRIHALPSEPSLYAITNDTVTTMYNISEITESVLCMAIQNQYSIDLEDSANLQKCPIIVHAFTSYDDLLNQYPELLI